MEKPIMTPSPIEVTVTRYVRLDLRDQLLRPLPPPLLLISTAPNSF